MIKVESPEHLAQIRADRKAFLKERRRQRFYSSTKEHQTRTPERDAMLMIRRYARKFKCEVIDDVYPHIVYERDKGICQLCNIQVNLPDFEIDHRIPLSRGGNHTYENVQTTHGKCNRIKYNHLGSPKNHD